MSGYVNVSLSDSLLQNYDSGASVRLYAEYPSGQYSSSSLTVSSSSVTEAFPSSNSHSSYFNTGVVYRYRYDDEYRLVDYYSTPSEKISQNITTNNRNWRIRTDSYHKSRDTVTCGAGNDTIEYVDVVNAGAGNDKITIQGGSVRGGAGNDFITCYYSGSINKDNLVVFEAQNGNDTINGDVDRIQWETGFTGMSVENVGSYSSADYDLTFYSGTDSLTLTRDDNFVQIVTNTGTEAARVYLDSGNGGGLIDGSNYGTLEVLLGDAGSNTIKAGSGGSSLWGGFGADDSMVGGAGSDCFFYGANDGIDYISNSDAYDRVFLYNANPIQGVYQSGSDLVIQYAVDNKLTIKDWSEAGMNNFQIYDGSIWGVHFENGTPTYQRKA